MSPARFHHYGVAVADLEGAVAWYRDVLGLRVETRFSLPEVPLDIVKLVSDAGVRVELLKFHCGAAACVLPAAAVICSI